MNKFIDIVFKRYFWILAIVLTTALPMLYFHLTHAHYNKVDTYFMEGDKDIKYYEEFTKKFGSDQFILLTLESDNIFTPKKLETIRSVTNYLNSLPDINYASSISNLKLPVNSSDLSLYQVIPEKGSLTEKQADDIKKLILESRLSSSRFISKNNQITGIYITLNKIDSSKEKEIFINKIKAHVKELSKNQLSPKYSGSPILETTIDRMMIRDNKLFTPITVVSIILVLFLLLRNFLLAVLGICSVIMIVLWGIGIMSATGATLNSITSIIRPILLAVSVADSVHLLSHFKKKYGEGFDFFESLRHAMADIYRPALYTSLTTTAGYLSFLNTEIQPVRHVGIYTGLGVMIGLALTFTYLPSLMIFFKKPLERSLDKYFKNKSQLPKEDSKDYFQDILDNLAIFINKHSIGVLVFVAAFLAVSFIGMAKIGFETNFVTYLPKKHVVRKEIDYIDSKFLGMSPHELIIKAKDETHDFTHPESLRLLEKIQNEVRDYVNNKLGSGEEIITSTLSIDNYFKELNGAFNEDMYGKYITPDKRLDILDYYDLGDSKVVDTMVTTDKREARISFLAKFSSSKVNDEYKHFIENRIKPEYEKHFEIKRTGVAALYGAMRSQLRIGQLTSATTAFIIIFIMMYFLTRSFKLTTASILPNTLPIFGTIGFMGWMGIPLDTATIMIASVTLGIAVDDTIHFLTWYKRNKEEGMDTKSALLKVSGDTGKAIVVTSLILSAGFGVLLLGSVKPIIAFGGLASLAMILAIFGDLIILPAIINILDKDK